MFRELALNYTKDFLTNKYVIAGVACFFVFFLAKLAHQTPAVSLSVIPLSFLALGALSFLKETKEIVNHEKQISTFILLLLGFVALYIFAIGQANAPIVTRNVHETLIFENLWLVAIVSLALTFRYGIHWALPGFYTLFCAKNLMTHGNAIGISSTDYAVLVELPIFLISMVIMGRFTRKYRGGKYAVESLSFFVMLAVALHFSNYFWAGFTKLQIAGFDWIENDLRNLMRAAIYLEQSPVFDLAGITTDSVQKIGKSVIVFANIATLSLQLFSLLFILNERL